MGKKLFATIVWTFAIALLSLMPSSNIPSVSWTSELPIDKIAHIVLYTIYTILLGRYLSAVWPKGVKIFIVAFATSLFYGILMEVLQYYLSPSRFFDILDIIANIIGSLAGLLILKIKF